MARARVCSSFWGRHSCLILSLSSEQQNMNPVPCLKVTVAGITAPGIGNHHAVLWCICVNQHASFASAEGECC